MIIKVSINMKAVVLAGGLGTRLRPITYEIPKPLVTVNKKPLLNYQIELLYKNGIKEICIVTDKKYYQDFQLWRRGQGAHFFSDKTKIFFQPKDKGTFGALTYIKSWLGNDAFIVNNSDELKSFSFGDAVKFHKNNDYDCTLTLVKVKNPQNYSVPLLKKNKIIQLAEKPKSPPSSYIYSGLCVLSPAIFKYMNKKYPSSLHLDVFPKLLKGGKLAGIKISKSRWHDCGTLFLWEKAVHNWNN